MTEDGLKFLSEWEGCRLHPYNDAAGYPTIGVGHLICDGENFSHGISHDEAMQLLSNDVADAEEMVREQLSVVLADHQIDALISFTFNAGVGAFKRSTLLKRVNTGAYDDVPHQFSRWNKAGGRILTGLVRRRKAEANLFTLGVYEGP